MIFGNRLRTLRKEKGLTQEELGKLINVTKVSICCYENDTRIPTLETLIALTKVFDVDINYFLGNDYYLVADENDAYNLRTSKEEIQFLEEIRKVPVVYNKVIDNPKRLVELIIKKIS